MSDAQLYHHPRTFKLENGKRIRNLKIAYSTFGKLNPERDNVVWVCHALTANSDVCEWWPGLFGDRDLFNPGEYFIVCANILGSAYGTTGPLDINPVTQQRYYLSFPDVTVKDMVAAHRILAEALGIGSIALLIGGSLGGQQALEWSINDPDRFQHLILLATNAVHSPWGIAFNESQRLAIHSDRTFYADMPNGGAKGLKAARSIALLSYRNYDMYGATQLEMTNDKYDDYKASSYQNYQGEKLVKCFNAYSYWYLSKAMDSHNVGRGHDSIPDALRKIKAKTLVIGISTDILFPLAEQKFIARHVPHAEYATINSLHGHDGFLIETKQLETVITAFLSKARKQEFVTIGE